MISFKPLSDDGASQAWRDIRKALEAHPDGADATEIIVDIGTFAEECGHSVSVLVYGNFVVARVFNGERYIFTFPIPFSDMAKECECRELLLELAEYSKRELIPLYLSDVPRDDLSLLTDLFPLLDARIYEDDEDLFSALVLNECMELEDFPATEGGGISLRRIEEKDKELYFELSTSDSVLKFWGYDAREDIVGATADDLLKEAYSEFQRGVAISLGIYEGERFLGEAVICNFDYFGGAEIAIRLLPSEQGRGIGSRTLELLVKLSRDIGLKEIRTMVHKENKGSLKMTGKYMAECGIDGDLVLYSLKL